MPSSSSAEPALPNRPQHEVDGGVPSQTPRRVPAALATQRQGARNPPGAARTPSQRSRHKHAPSHPHRGHHPPVSLDSPFLSPPGTVRGRRGGHPMEARSRKARPEPLVLDPSASAGRGPRFGAAPRGGPGSLPSPAFSSPGVLPADGGRNTNTGSGGTVKELFRVATKGLREHHAAAATGGGYHLHATPAAAGGGTGSSAAVFARSGGVARAGFLQKLGENIPEFKRRFFVLKPETSVYYYLSPSETEPRGKMDLEGSSVEPLETTPDGRFRFAVSLKPPPGAGARDTKDARDWNNDDDDDDNNNDDWSHCDDHNDRSEHHHHGDRRGRKIVLEARTREIGEEWIRHMRGERVSFLKDRVGALESAKTEQSNTISDLEQQLEHFRMIEADRDGALEDARNWKEKFHRLDEALRLLTQRVRKPLAASPPPAKEPPKAVDENENEQREHGAESPAQTEGTGGDGEDSGGAKHGTSGTDETTEHKDETAPGSPGTRDVTTPPSKRESAPALLDDLAQEDMDVEELIDVPGTYFSGLSNAFRQQRESSRLASIEASTAVEDVLKANERVDAIQKRMKKAEKQILNLWEENCAIRKTLKQKKREKRVLVREVKQLQNTVRDLEDDNQRLSRSARDSDKPSEEDGTVAMADTMIGSDEERLIIELEEHVASSIRLHNRLVAGADLDRDAEQSISTNPASFAAEGSDLAASVAGWPGLQKGGIEVSQPKLLSLLDDDSDSDESGSEQEDPKDGDSRLELGSLLGSVASATDTDHARSIGATGTPASASSVGADGSSSQRANPLLKLDHDDESTEIRHLDPHFRKPSSPKLVTENGQATSRLVCPLADVVDTMGGSSSGGNGRARGEGNEELRVHHITFYSRKIGLQFQKASPAPQKPRGLLTDVLAADLAGGVDGSDKTAAELRSVASIASLAGGGTNARGEEVTCPLALPEDIVLVCGFEGFDDSGVNQRPRLGARLVAFDGVSVEVGKWTFENISKAIKSRGRPLTLSFRNDFLTTEQRAILTKAIKDVDAKRDPVRSVIQYERPPSATPSLHSALSYESGHFLNNEGTQGGHHPNAHGEGGIDLDISIAATEESNCWHRFPGSSSSSLSSFYKENSRSLPRPPSTSSVSTHRSRNSFTSTAKNYMYSFQEAGSPNRVSSLVNNLAEKVASSSERQQRSEIFRGTPSNRKGGSERSRRFGIGINPSGTQQHQDFQSNLL